MEPQTPTHLGEIVMLDQSGVAMVKDEDCHGQYPFTFDKIVGYGGQYPRELTDFSKKGLRKDVMVRFTLDSENRIDRVYPRDVKEL